MIGGIKVEVITSTIDWGTFAYDAGVLAAAAVVVAVLSWIVTLWRWRPHLSIDQSASWRRMPDGKLCITVAIRYRNTSNYRAIQVQEMVVDLQRLMPLSSDESRKASKYGRSALTRIAQKKFYWHKDKSRLLEPGETESEVFLFFVSSKEPRLSAFVVYTFVFQKKQPTDKADSIGNRRGWGIATCHDIDPQGGGMTDTTTDKPEKVGGTEIRSYEPSQPPPEPSESGESEESKPAPPPPPSKDQD